MLLLKLFYPGVSSLLRAGSHERCHRTGAAPLADWVQSCLRAGPGWEQGPVTAGSTGGNRLSSQSRAWVPFPSIKLSFYN